MGELSIFSEPNYVDYTSPDTPEFYMPQFNHYLDNKNTIINYISTSLRNLNFQVHTLTQSKLPIHLRVLFHQHNPMHPTHRNLLYPPLQKLRHHTS